MINSTKGNPSWYGDLVGDWREEIIVPDATRLADIKIFSTWYPTAHKFPWLMTDHCYWMSVLNENIGYNQPTNTGYYLGSDLTNDAEAWSEAAKVQNKGMTMGIEETHHPFGTSGLSQATTWYDLTGRRISAGSPLRKGIYLRDGKKIYIQ